MEDFWQQYAQAPMAWIEAHRHPALDALFSFLTFLGTESFLLFFVAFGYWLADRRSFTRAAAMLIVSGWTNSWLKGAFLEPRPSVSYVVEAGGWSFPSGHAQVAAAFWGWFALEALRAGRGRRALGLVLLALGVAASRFYLGVHYPHDVIVGFLLGALQVVLFAAAFGADWRIPVVDRRTAPAVCTVAGLSLLAVGLLFHPTVQGLGVRLLGAGLGWAFVGGHADDRAPQGAGARVRVAFIGLLGLLFLWVGGKSVLAGLGFSDSLWGAFVRYFLVGAWIAHWGPWMSRRLFER